MPKRRRTKKRAKGVTLSSEYWFRNSKELAQLREELLTQQRGLCAVTGKPTTSPVVDHSHSDGVIRGVLDSQANMLEGRYLSLFNKSKIGVKYNLTFPEFLINLGIYLQKAPTETRLHPKHMEAFRKKVKRWRKEELILRLEKDYGIIPEPKTLVADLVQMYVQAWVRGLESKDVKT